MTTFQNVSVSPRRTALSEVRSRLPRPEVLLLGLALLWTVAAKARVLFGQRPVSLSASLLEITLPDFAYFGFVLASFSGLYLIGFRRSAARITVFAAGLVALWAVLNAAWLLSTSVQLQPGVLGVLAKDPVQFWPTVQAHLIAAPLYSIPIVITILMGAGWFVYRLVRPVDLTTARSTHLIVFAAATALGATALISHEVERRMGKVEYSGQVIGFSSHWSAMQASVGLIGNADVVSAGRHVPRAGERLVVPPVEWSKPNVVVIFMESVSYDASSLSDRERTTTPTLEAIAAEGAHFTRTYVPVPQTNKAFFSGLTGCTPDIQPDYAEAVLVDRPYESLATMLGSEGYRSAFFQMADGEFECGPGLFSNLAFDWAWFFENLEDESTRVGYLSADDFAMIDPMFEWVDSGSQPFLLSMITTVAHDPYYLPEWFEPDPPESRQKRYLRAVEYSDLFVRAVMNELESRGLLENTLLCVLGDHGDSFRPEARRARFVPYEEVIRIPWVMRWPGHIEPGTTYDSLSSQLDVTPTILATLGWDISGGNFDGRNAMIADPERRLYFASWYKDSPMGYIQGDQKVFYWPYLERVFLTDLSEDPNEQNMQTMELPEGESIVESIRRWREASQFIIDARRYRDRTAFDHWQMNSSGRSAWAQYVP